MSKEEKLKERFKRLPKDFTFEELRRLLRNLGFSEHQKGFTSGSRTMFVRERDMILLHKPHPSNQIKPKALKNIYLFLIMNGYL